MEPRDPEKLKSSVGSRRLRGMPDALVGGRYELSEFVSKGGMGAVYRARDMELDRWVAVKCLLDVRSQERRALAIREAKTLASLSHPNIMRIYDILTADDQVWIVSEWLDGRSLEQFSFPFPTAAALAVMAQIYDALAAAHEAQIVHRDIKPANVILGSDGRVTVIDFGVAYAPGSSSGETMAGSLRYTDPRILEGITPDALSDCFSAALLQIEMMTGATVQPDLAPLPLHRYIKKNFQRRIDHLLEGAYPPLTNLAKRFATWPVSESVMRDGAARESALYAQDQLSRITSRSPRQYLEGTICCGVYHDQEAEARIRAEAERSIASKVLTPRQKGAWFGFRSRLAEKDPRPAPQSLDPSADDKISAFTKSMRHWASPHMVIVGACLVAAIFLTFMDSQELTSEVETFAPGEIAAMQPVVIPDVPGEWREDSSPNPKEEWGDPSLVERLSEERALETPPLPDQGTPETIDSATVVTDRVPVQMLANAWAEVYIDGKLVGKLPHAKPFLLAPGPHQIKLVNPTTDVLERTIVVTTSEEQKFRFELTPKTTKKQVLLAIPGQLLIDGVDHGIVQEEEIHLTYGTHAFEVRRQGQKPVQKQIAIGLGSAREIRLE